MSKVMKLFCCVGALALVLVASSAFATAYAISLNDPSFESPVVGNGDDETDYSATWGSYSSAMSAGLGNAMGIIFNPTNVEFAGTTDVGGVPTNANGVLPNGGQVGFLAYGSEGDIDMRLNQTTGHTIVSGETFTLNFSAGRRADEMAHTWCGVWSGVTAKLVDGTGAVIGSQDFTTAPALGAFSQFTMTATATGSNSGLLKVEFFSDVNTTSYNAHEFLDSVSVSTNTAPEPSTVVLLATGLIGLLCYAWKKRK